jgi:hypothetical protein
MVLKDAEKLLGDKEAVLVFRCADCKALELLEGYEDVHLATGSQLAHESRKLYCAECEEG